MESTRPLPNKTNWLKYPFCRHEFAQDALGFFAVCERCGWPRCYAHPRRIHRILYKIDKRGTVIGDLVIHADRRQA